MRGPSKPMMRALCLQMGGGCAPPNPPLFFKPGNACLKACEALQNHDASTVFANGGGCAPPPPQPTAFFEPGNACLKACEALQTHDASTVFANGKACAPPQPPRFFLSRATLASKHARPFQTHDASTVLESMRGPSKPMMRALCLQMGGGLRPPQPPAFFKPGNACLKACEALQTHDANTVFANGGVCALPNPPPPAFFFFKPGNACFKACEALPNP